MKIGHDWLLLLGSLLIVGALYNHYLGHSVYFVEILFIAAGSGLILYSIIKYKGTNREGSEGLIIALLKRFMSAEQSARFLLLAGFLIIAGWSIWKISISGQTNLQMEDFIVTLFGISLILYYTGPSRYAAQKDFAVLYLLFLTIVFAGIWRTYIAVTGQSFSKVTAYSEYYFITIPVILLVQLFGVHANADLNLSGHGLSNTISYDYHGHHILLGLGSGCSGLYSAGLFFSAFLAFVLVRYKKVDFRILGALAIGLLVTWFSNIFRMAITIKVGSVWGHPALAFVHSYIGILIFIAFVTIFWFLIIRWLDKSESRAELPPAGPETQKEVPTTTKE